MPENHARGLAIMAAIGLGFFLGSVLAAMLGGFILICFPAEERDAYHWAICYVVAQTVVLVVYLCSVCCLFLHYAPKVRDA